MDQVSRERMLPFWMRTGNNDVVIEHDHFGIIESCESARMPRWLQNI